MTQSVSPQLATEQDNLRAALHWALEQGAAETALLLVRALTTFWWDNRRWSEGLAWAEAALALPEAQGWTAARAGGLFAAAIMQFCLGNSRAAHARLEESVAIWRELADGGPNLAFALLFFGWTMQGDPATCRAAVAEAVAILRAWNVPAGLALALLAGGNAAWLMGDTRAARSHLRESATLLRAQHNHLILLQALLLLGHVDFAEGDTLAARSQFTECLLLARQLGDAALTSWALSGLGHVALRERDHARAIERFGESLALSLKPASTNSIIIIPNLAGLARACSRQRPVTAAQLCGTAATVRETFGLTLAPELQLLLQETLDAVRAALSDEGFEAAWTEGQMTPLEQAIAGALTLATDLLAEPAPAAHGLTARELEVARLVARGLSNRAIAATLVLSVRTVERHLDHIYAKTGLHGRQLLRGYVQTNTLDIPD
jgi:non-specific serine/threonine protein kinase